MRPSPVILIGLSCLLAHDVAAQGLETSFKSREIIQHQTSDCREIHDPYEVWEGIRSETQATAFLTAKFDELGSLPALAQWLRCQGFSVSQFQGGPRLNGRVKISAGFNVYYRNGRRLLRIDGWASYLRPAPWSQLIEIFFDADGRIHSIDFSDTIL